MNEWINDIQFECPGPVGRGLKKLLINPMANYLPAGMWRSLLRFGKSELAAANWSDPGGWRSMVISYEGNPRQLADRLLVGGGTIPMALRNRRRLAGRILARLIDRCPSDPVHVMGLGAGPGYITMQAMQESSRRSIATLVDLSNDAFDHGRQRAQQLGLAERIRFIQADVRDIAEHLSSPPDILKMMGICEYLTDEQVVSVASAAAAVMPAGSEVVFNSLSRRHGTDRFFRRVFGLHMNHRSPQQLQELMRKAGFDDFDGICEPLGVYHVIVGRRQDSSKG